MKYILYTLLGLMMCGSTFAQDGYDIEIKIDNYEHDSLIVAFYYGKQTLILDSLLRNGDEPFRLQGDEPLDHGVYLFLTYPDNEYTQFLIHDDQKFTIEADMEDTSIVKFKGSEENNRFYDYLAYLKEQRKKIGDIHTEKDIAKSEDKDTTVYMDRITVLDNEVRQEQLRIIEEHPNSILRIILDANIPLDVPEYEGTEKEVQREKYLYYREHYFDRIQLGNSASLITPFFHQRVDYFINKLTPQSPDSISATLDTLLTYMEPAEDTYRYYLSHFLNEYANSKIVGYDAVYVHLADTYYAQDKAPWVKEENLKKILQNARGIKPTLIGKTAKDFTVYNQAGDTITLSKIDADYRVLFFWAPDCGHCAKAIPHINTFYEKWKGSGEVELITICNKSGDKTADCWKSVEEKGMQKLINTADEKRIATVLSRYYVTKTPKIFVIDRDMKIVMKGIGAEQLDTVLTEVMKMEQQKKEKSLERN